MQTDVMIVAAHPDDAEIGMGGTIAALRAGGASVLIVDLSNGEPTPHGSPELRSAEAARAAEILDVKRLTLTLKNREIFDTVENRKLLATVIREYRPELLFLPFPEDAHPDHVQASALGVASRFYSKFVKADLDFSPHFPRKFLYYFCIHMRLALTPTFVFDVTLFHDKKMESLAAYHSQFGMNPNNQAVLEKIQLQDSYWGQQAGCRYAEPFVSRESAKITSAEALLNI